MPVAEWLANIWYFIDIYKTFSAIFKSGRCEKDITVAVQRSQNQLDGHCKVLFSPIVTGNGKLRIILREPDEAH